MKVEMRDIDEVKPYEANPRQNDAAVDAVAQSIREFGFRQPIVVDEAGVIVVGHTRWKAATSLPPTQKALTRSPPGVAPGLAVAGILPTGRGPPSPTPSCGGTRPRTASRTASR